MARAGWRESGDAVRLIRRSPGFSAFVIVVLAVGIGAAVSVFTLVRAVLLRDPPFEQPDRLVWMYNLRTERDRAPLSIPDLADYQRQTTSVEAFAPFTNWTANLTGSGEPERLEGVRVSGNFFDVIGTRAHLGRPLQQADEAASSRAAVITHGLWRRRFGGDAALVGREVTLNGTAYTLVGVMPPGFVFPFRDAEVAVPLPLRDDSRRADRGANFLRVIARLKQGVTSAQASAEMNIVARGLQKQFPEEDARKVGITLYPLLAEIVRDYERVLWMAFAAVGLLLAVSCGNLANLLLVRSVGRRSEFAVRVALGASTSRIVWQLLAEAGVLALCGGVLGLGLARAAIAAWRLWGPASFPRMADVSMDGRVLLFAGLAVVGSALVAGLVPAWLASRAANVSLNEGRGYTLGAHGKVRRGFVMLQVAGAVVLIVCTTLVARGFARLERVDPGFEPGRAWSIQLSLPPTRYSTRETIVEFYQALHDRVTTMPSVRSAGAVSLLPLSGLLNTMDVVFPDRPAPPPDEVPQAHFRIASPGYFEAAGIRLRAGRSFDASDTRRGRHVAIVSQTFAERHWPGTTAIGKVLQLPIAPAPETLEVIGVVSDVKQFTLDREPTPDLYVSVLQMPAGQSAQLAARMYWVVRARDEARDLLTGIRAAVRAVDPGVATSSVRTLDAVVESSLSSRRTNVRLLEGFGTVALVLAVMGVYAIAAFSIGARKRELALRSAFGAGRRTLVALVLAEELRPVVVGLVIGLAAALAATRVFGDLVFAVAPTDPPTYAGVALALLAVCVLAVYLPARRAGSVDPVALLRGQ
jgi:putative ABC transport system permease protein